MKKVEKVLVCSLIIVFHRRRDRSSEWLNDGPKPLGA